MKKTYIMPLCTVCALNSEATVLTGSIGVSSGTEISSDNQSDFDIASKKRESFDSWVEE